jgi:hypothetical protein
VRNSEVKHHVRPQATDRLERAPVAQVGLDHPDPVPAPAQTLVLDHVAVTHEHGNVGAFFEKRRTR